MIATFAVFAAACIGVAAITLALWELDHRNHRADFSARHEHGTDFHRWITDTLPDIPPARIFEEPKP